MRKWLIVTVLVVAGILGTERKASAWFFCGPPGWWTCGYAAYVGYPYCYGGGMYGSFGAYYYAPYYPWFAYYNYSNSPYAWPGGYVAGRYPAYLPPHASTLLNNPVDRFAAAPADGKPATVVASLPADAELFFNGVPAKDLSGGERSFVTGPLAPGRSYQYTLTARVTRDGKAVDVTEKVVVKAGEETKVSLMPKADATSVAGK